MLLASLFLCGSALLGFAIVNLCLRRLLSFEEKWLWGVVVGWSVSTTAVYLVARWQAKLTRGSVTWATMLICLLAILLLAPYIRQLTRERLRLQWKPQLTGLLLVLALFTPIYWQLFSSHLFEQGPGGIYSGGSASADLNFHAAISSSFLYGDNFPPSYTPSAGKPLLYPFLPDFQTAILMCTGLSMRGALLITSLTLALVTTGLFFYFAVRITKKSVTGVVATILFLLNGGLGFIDLIRDWFGSGKSLLQFWNSLEVNYANYAEHGLHWPNIIADAFVPQRTVLFGLPIGLIVLTIFASDFDQTFGEEKNTRRAMYLFAGVLTGLLPFFHIHTYISLGLVSVFLFLLKPQRLWVSFWLPAIVLAITHLASLLGHATNGSFVRLQPGWMGHDERFFPLYLVRNLGLPLLLAIPAWFTLDRVWRKFYVAFVLLLVVSLTVVVSPNLFDNGKLIYYWHVVNSVIIANWLVQVAFTHRQAAVATVLALICIATGITALQSEKLQHGLVFSNEDIAASKFAIDHTSSRALFLTAPTTNQPILSLAGRSVLRGPTSWLWSHGYEFRDREADIRRIYAGVYDALDLLTYYDVDYVFVGEAERNELRAKTEFFDANFPIAYQSANIKIYDARSPVKTHEARVPVSRSYDRLASYDPYALLADFPETSFFVYRGWIAANARMPTHEEFKRAMRGLTSGVRPGSLSSRERLEENRQRLINELMESQELSTRINGSSNSEYVNTVLTNAGLREDRNLAQQLSIDLDRQTETRSTVLRKVIDDKRLFAREYNSAFLLVHYFGYLNRNPTDLPDTSLEGFNYWRRILDSSRDYRSISRAFLESEEYRKREIRAVP